MYDTSNRCRVQEVEEQNNRLVYGDCGTIFTRFRSFRLNETYLPDLCPNYAPKAGTVFSDPRQESGHGGINPSTSLG